jgi:hypothetical protein
VQRVAVRRGTDGCCGGDIAAGTGAVLDHELLTEMVRQPLAHDACDDVDRAPGGKADQPLHRAVGVVGSGGGAGGEVEKKAEEANRAKQGLAQEIDHYVTRHFLVTIAGMLS